MAVEAIEGGALAPRIDSEPRSPAEGTPEPRLVYRLPARVNGPGAIARKPARGARAKGDSAPTQLETYRTNFLERGSEGTKFTIDGDPADVLMEQLADDPRAHYFRREVAKHLDGTWSRRALALRTCGEAGARCDCDHCGAAHVLPYRCGARACPTCARSASALKCEKIALQAESATSLQLLEPWDGIGPAHKKGWRMLHLTTRAKGTEDERYQEDTLGLYVDAVRRAWGPFWRSTSWGNRRHCVSKSGGPSKRVRRDTLAAMGIEIGDGGMVHIHAAVYGEFIPDTVIAHHWAQACRDQGIQLGGFVKINRMRYKRGDRKGELLTSCDDEGFRDALHEVLKYLTKGHKAANLPERAGRAAAAEYAMRGVRRVETCGALRLVPSIDEKDLATNQQACEACGVEGAWTWRGVRAPHYVQRNKGFGLTTIRDEQDLALIDEQASEIDTERKLAAEPESERTRRELLRTTWDRRHGLFYGGHPPPWMDDPEEWSVEDVFFDDQPK